MILRHHHMQDDPIVVWIRIMAVRVPGSRVAMDFHIPVKGDVADTNASAGEIRPAVCIHVPGSEDGNGLAVRSGEALRVEELMLPHVTDELFGYQSLREEFLPVSVDVISQRQCSRACRGGEIFAR